MRVSFSVTTGIIFASERQKFAHKCTCFIVDCPELEIVDQEWEFPFLGGLGAGVLVALALASICVTCARTVLKQ